MPITFTHKFTAGFKGTSSFPTGHFINNQFVDGSEGKTIDVINPTNGKVITQIAEGTAADVDKAVNAAKAAFETTWGLHTPGHERGRLLGVLADLMTRDSDELAALETLDNGKTFKWAKSDIGASLSCIRYYSGWADKNSGQVCETDENKLAYTRHEPIGVVGQIIPWNFPLMMFAWKVGPALATGNAIVMKPSENTPLTALKMCTLFAEAGFPPGVFNVVQGYGPTVGAAISSHMEIEKVAFTGSTLVGRKIMEAAAKSNLKKVTLELGGKSPNIVFDDANLEEAIKWSTHGIFYNHGQACCAGSRIFVHEKIYDQFLTGFTAAAEAIKLGDPFGDQIDQGPQISQLQFDRIMGYIDSAKADNATIHTGGLRHGSEGFFIQPTLITNTQPTMKVVQEEIFGPVGVVIKFSDEDDVIRQANDTVYGLACAVFSRDIKRALRVAHRLKAGTAWVNCVNSLNPQIPFGGYKQSGIGRELGEYALANYTNVKAVHVNLGP